MVAPTLVFLISWLIAVPIAAAVGVGCGPLLALRPSPLVLCPLPLRVSTVGDLALGLVHSPVPQGGSLAFEGEDLETVHIGVHVVLDAKNGEEPVEEGGAIDVHRLAGFLSQNVLDGPQGGTSVRNTPRRTCD